MMPPYNLNGLAVEHAAAQRAECRDWPRAPQVGDKCESELCKMSDFNEKLLEPCEAAMDAIVALQDTNDGSAISPARLTLRNAIAAAREQMAALRAMVGRAS